MDSTKLLATDNQGPRFVRETIELLLPPVSNFIILIAVIATTIKLDVDQYEATSSLRSKLSEARSIALEAEIDGGQRFAHFTRKFNEIKASILKEQRSIIRG